MGMLILTRRIKEELVLGDDEITIEILGIKGNQVRIGINAPRDMPVHRREIFDKIKAKGEEL